MTCIELPTRELQDTYRIWYNVLDNLSHIGYLDPATRIEVGIVIAQLFPVQWRSAEAAAEEYYMGIRIVVFRDTVRFVLDSRVRWPDIVVDIMERPYMPLMTGYDSINPVRIYGRKLSQPHVTR